MRGARTGLTLIAAFLVLPGCRQVQHQAAPVPSPRAVGVPAGQALRLSEADSGHAYTVSVGTPIEVYLHGSRAAMWSVINRAGDAVKVAPSGKGALMIGVRGGFFAAVRSGTARLSATRPPCHDAGCAIRGFIVTITVR
jgi:hypothetical protein